MTAIIKTNDFSYYEHCKQLQCYNPMVYGDSIKMNVNVVSDIFKIKNLAKESDEFQIVAENK